MKKFSFKKLLLSLASAGFGLALAVSLYLFIIQPRNRHWGLSVTEATHPFPGDELLSRYDYASTQALVIAAPPAKVWPWLVQIGQNRGGYYSYSWIENLFGLQMRNTNRIVPQWQTLAVGDAINLRAEESMTVAALATGKYIVCDMPMGQKATWGFYLEPLPGEKSRLLSRLRMNTGGNSWLNVAMFDAGHFIMDRKMLTGIRERVERQAGKFSFFALAEWSWIMAMILCALAITVLFFYHHRPWNGITAGLMSVFWVIGVFCSYASLIVALIFVALVALAFTLPRRLRSG